MNEASYDRIVANPPFADGQDIAHVTHALAFLRPGGRLVAIMSSGFTFRQDRAALAFRDLVEERGGTVEELSADAFKVSGTGVRAVLVTIDA
jgi:16S rRNA G1207 methylase RsmC